MSNDGNKRFMGRFQVIAATKFASLRNIESAEHAATSPQTSLDSTFGVDFNAEFLTAIHSIEANHLQEEQNKVRPVRTHLEHKPDNVCVERTKLTANDVVSECPHSEHLVSERTSEQRSSVHQSTDKLLKSLVADEASLISRRDGMHMCESRSAAPAVKIPRTKAADEKVMSSPSVVSELSLSLCSPLYKSTPMNTFKQKQKKKQDPGDRPMKKQNLSDRPMKKQDPSDRPMKQDLSDRPMKKQDPSDRPMKKQDPSDRPMKKQDPSDRPMKKQDPSDRPMKKKQLSDGTNKIALFQDVSCSTPRINRRKSQRQEDTADSHVAAAGVLPVDGARSSRETAAAAAASCKVTADDDSDRLLLSNWGLPEEVLRQYEQAGITRMFPWQVECLCTGNVLAGGNLVYSAPTSAGKTMVAELLVLKRVLEKKKKAIFVMPYVSVAREKMYSLQKLWRDTGVRVEGLMGAQNAAGGFQALDVAVCTIEKANSLVNRLLEDGGIENLGVVVVDELHMVGDAHRGYLLELLLTKLRYVQLQRTANRRESCDADDEVEESAHGIQLIGMSATLPNLPLLARWLDAALYRTDFRPVPLTELVSIGADVYDARMTSLRRVDEDVSRTVALMLKGGDEDHVIALCLETIRIGCSVLIFCPTKSWCEKLADQAARAFHGLLRHQAAKQPDGDAALLLRLDRRALSDVTEQLRRCPVGLDTLLGRTVPQGVAYHHAGLTFDERDIIEGAFKTGALKVLVATSTLSSGVNLPARRVIVRTPVFHGQLIDVLTYKQMVGRAGRKGIDTSGESILVCKPTERVKAEALMTSELPAVTSCLQRASDGVTSSLKRAILEIVVSGVAQSAADVQHYAQSTLLAASLLDDADSMMTSDAIGQCLQFLLDSEFIASATVNNEDEGGAVAGQRYIATQLGSAVLSSALSPDEGLAVFAELQKARRCFVLENELHVIYLVTPVYMQEVGTIDWYQYLCLWESLSAGERRVAELVGVSENFLARAVRGRLRCTTEQQQRQLNIHKRFYTALVLSELVNEVPLPRVADKYKCSRGVLQSLQQSAATFAGMVTVFCKRLSWHNLELLLSQFQSRLTFGVQRELVDLVRVSLLNGQRARLVYNGGFQTVASLAGADVMQIETILKNAMPFESKRVGDGENRWEAAERARSRCIWLTGQRALTEAEAALLIVEEAKALLQQDLQVLGVEWRPPGGEEANQHGATVSAGARKMSSQQQMFGTPVTSQKQNTDASRVDSFVLTSAKSTRHRGITCPGNASHVSSITAANVSVLSPPPPPVRRSQTHQHTRKIGSFPNKSGRNGDLRPNKTGRNGDLRLSNENIEITSKSTENDDKENAGVIVRKLGKRKSVSAAVTASSSAKVAKPEDSGLKEAATDQRVTLTGSRSTANCKLLLKTSLRDGNRPAIASSGVDSNAVISSSRDDNCAVIANSQNVVQDCDATTAAGGGVCKMVPAEALPLVTAPKDSSSDAASNERRKSSDVTVSRDVIASRDGFNSPPPCVRSLSAEVSAPRCVSAASENHFDDSFMLDTQALQAVTALSSSPCLATQQRVAALSDTCSTRNHTGDGHSRDVVTNGSDTATTSRALSAQDLIARRTGVDQTPLQRKARPTGVTSRASARNRTSFSATDKITPPMFSQDMFDSASCVLRRDRSEPDAGSLSASPQLKRQRQTDTEIVAADAFERNHDDAVHLTDLDLTSNDLSTSNNLDLCLSLSSPGVESRNLRPEALVIGRSLKSLDGKAKRAAITESASDLCQGHVTSRVSTSAGTRRSSRLRGKSSQSSAAKSSILKYPAGGSSKPQASAGGSSKLQASAGGSTKPQSSAGGSSKPQSSAGGSSKPQSSVGGSSKPQSSAGGSSNPQSSAGGSSKPQSSAGGSSKPQASAGGSSKPQSSVGGSSKPQSSAGGCSKPQSSAGGSSKPQALAGGSFKPQSSAGGTSKPPSSAATRSSSKPEPLRTDTQEYMMNDSLTCSMLEKCFDSCSFNAADNDLLNAALDECAHVHDVSSTGSRCTPTRSTALHSESGTALNTSAARVASTGSALQACATEMTATTALAASTPCTAAEKREQDGNGLQLYQLTPGTEGVINALLDATPLRCRRRAPLRRRRDGVPATGDGCTKEQGTPHGKRTKQDRKITASGRQTPGSGRRTPGSGRRTPGSGRRTPGNGRRTPGSGRRTPGSGRRTPASGRRTPASGRHSTSLSARSSRNQSNASDLLPPTPTCSPKPNVKPNAKQVNTPTRLIGGSGLTPKRGARTRNDATTTAAKALNLDTAQQLPEVGSKVTECNTVTTTADVGLDFDISLEVSGLLAALDESTTTMPLTNEAFTLTDVCASAELFDVFVRELRGKSHVALCVAGEKRANDTAAAAAAATTSGNIGAQFNKVSNDVMTRAHAELDSQSPNDVIVHGVAVCCGNRDAFYVPLACDSTSAEHVSMTRRLDALRDVLQCRNNKLTVIAYDVKQQYKALSQGCDIQVRGQFEDPKVAAWLLDPGAKEMNLHRMITNCLPLHAHLLDGIAPGCGYSSLGFGVDGGASKRQAACVEAVLVYHVMHHYREQLQEKALLTSFTQVEMPAVIVLANMELNGFGFSDAECESQKQIILEQMSALEQRAYQLAGHPFSLSATEDVAQVLFVELRLPPSGDPAHPHPQKTLGPARRNVRGRIKAQYSTAKDVLEKLKTLHPLPGLILEWRRINSALSKTVFPLQKSKIFNHKLQMYRVYGECQTFTATGRVSMQEPNLQNIPNDFDIHLPGAVNGRAKDVTHRLRLTRSKQRQVAAPAAITYAVSMRHAFTPFKGGVILAADYSQLELRVIAHLSRDVKLTRILNEGGDVFRLIASQWKSVEVEHVTAEQRQQTKQICYGMLYGMGAKALGEQLGVEENEAACFMDSFKAKYTGMRSFLRQTVYDCRERGYVQTVMGRRRYLNAIKSTNIHAKAHAERQAVNTTVQGSAADLVKKAMIDIDVMLQRAFPQCVTPVGQQTPRDSTQKLDIAPRGGYFVLQLHDELIYEVNERDLTQVARIVKTCMEQAMTLDVKLPVKLQVGPTWGKLQSFAVDG